MDKVNIDIVITNRQHPSVVKFINERGGEIIEDNGRFVNHHVMSIIFDEDKWANELLEKIINDDFIYI